MSDSNDPLYLGFDLSTQQLKAIIINSRLQTIAQAKVDFDADLGPKYAIRKDVIVRDAAGQVVAPVAMWLEALDLVLDRLRDAAAPTPDDYVMSRVRAVAGAGQQHGSVFWNDRAAACLADLDPTRSLVEQLPAALAHPESPNWQDHSTQVECDAFDAALGGRERLADLTGSGAHHRFTGPQIMRLRRLLPDVYARTTRISLVSSWLASVLLGAIAPLDVSDVCGMNLWDMSAQRFDGDLLALAAGGHGAPADDLRAKLGEPVMDGGAFLGPVSPYFVTRHGFSRDCRVVPFTGDNPATMLALPLRPLDAIVSLGTSTTFLMNTPNYRPDGAYHFFNHPTTPGHYMFMLCYKNGGLAREMVRDALSKADDAVANTSNSINTNTNKNQQLQHPHDPWQDFNQAVLDTPPLGITFPGDRAKLGLYFCLRETVPNIRAGTWRFTCNPTNGSALTPATTPWPASADARIIVESQALSMRLRARDLVHAPKPSLPAQPRRIYLVGGGAANPALARVLGDVLGGVDGVYRLVDVGGAACALGGAYKALWACERGDERQSLDEVIAARWREEDAVERVGDGFREGFYRAYGDVMGAFEEMERRVLAEEST